MQIVEQLNEQSGLHSEIVRRIDLLYQIQHDSQLEQLEYELCRRDVVRFVNNWGWTYDPRRKERHFPFTLYPFQTEALTWITERYENRENGLIEKSRDMGVTWLTAAWLVHRFIFDEGFLGLVGSRKESYVDNKTISSVFGKMRYLLKRLPKFLAVQLKEETKEDSHMSLMNLAKGNIIQGESTNQSFGRGARSSICFLDEFAHIPSSELIWTAIVDNSNCVIPLSTPNGRSNQFADLRHKTPIKTLSIHWSQHPLKSNNWYEERKKEMKAWQIAQELDLSYDRSTAGRVYTRFERHYHVANEMLEWDYVAKEYFITWDFGIADPTAMLFGQITGTGEIQILECFELSDYDIEFFIPIAQKQLPVEISLLDKEVQDEIRAIVGRIPKHVQFKHYGDHAGTARTVNSKRSARDRLSEHGIKLITSGHQAFDVRIGAVDNLLKLRPIDNGQKWFSPLQISPHCTKLIDALNNYQYDATERSDSQLVPKHDWTSHMVSALEFFAINRFPQGSNKPTAREVRAR